MQSSSDLGVREQLAAIIAGTRHHFFSGLTTGATVLDEDRAAADALLAAGVTLPHPPAYELVLACGHGWAGEGTREQAEEMLALTLSTGDSAYCQACTSQQPITGPVRESAAVPLVQPPATPAGMTAAKLRWMARDIETIWFQIQANRPSYEKRTPSSHSASLRAWADEIAAGSVGVHPPPAPVTLSTVCAVCGGASTGVLTDEERDTVQNWVRGIEQGHWNPTPSTKRLLASVLRAVLVVGSLPVNEAPQ